MLRAENLIKTYKGRSVVKGISLEVENYDERANFCIKRCGKNHLFLYDCWIGIT